MQPARLGARISNFVAAALLGILLLAPTSRAQAVLETTQQTNERIKALSAASHAPSGEYVIGRGDVLTIEVFDVPELSREVRVSQTGSVGLPLLPVRLQLTGLTEIQAQQKIAEVLEANGLVSHPQVTVLVKEKKSRPITILGAVVHSMVYEADRPVTLLEVLAEAGGIANDAGDSVRVTRAERPADPASNEPPEIGPQDVAGGTASSANTPEAAAASQVEKPQDTAKAAPSADPPSLTNTITVNLRGLLEGGDSRDNIPLQGGDIVTVPHAGIVYVLGAVARPGGFVVSNDREQLSTLKALALAGGLNATARKHQAVIIRKDEAGQQHQVMVDLGKVLNQESEDVKLQASDVLYVPQSGSRAALLRAAEIGLGIGTAVAIFRVGQR
jgi:polysaccharide export outer membrane protein